MQPKSDKKTALITGVGGQDGWYMSRLLLSKGFKVFGTTRDSQKIEVPEGVSLIEVDLTQDNQIGSTIREVSPDYCFHLAAHHHSSGARQANLAADFNLFSKI